MIFNRPAALIDKDTDTTFAHGLLVRKRDLTHTGSATHLALVRIMSLLHHRLLQSLISILVYLFLDHILREYLIVEFQRLLVNQLVVETFAISWLNYVALGVYAILVADLRGSLMLALKFLFLFHGVRVVLNEAPCR